MKTIRDWAFAHKKMVTALLTALISLIPAEVLNAETKKELIAIGMAFIVGQGVADVGKPAEKLRQEARKAEIKNIEAGMVHLVAAKAPKV